MKKDISIIVVNFFTGEKILNLIKKLNKQSFDIIIIDNGDSIDLSSKLPNQSNIIYHKMPYNSGFAKACNFAVDKFINSDKIFFLNPDTDISVEEIIRLSEKISDKRVSAISPKVYFDSEKEYIVTPASEKTPFKFFLYKISMNNSLFYSIFSYIIHRRNYNYYLHNQLFFTNTLSGGHFMINRATFKRYKFDERFFLYFEDTDLFRRMYTNGEKLAYDNSASIIHTSSYSNHKAQMIENSKNIYYEKHFKKFINFLKYINSINNNIEAKFKFLGKYSENMVVARFDTEKNIFLEISPDSTFVTSLLYKSRVTELVIKNEVAKFFLDRKFYFRVTLLDENKTLLYSILF